MIGNEGDRLPKKPLFALGGKPRKPRDVIIPMVKNRWRIFFIGTFFFLILLPIGVLLRDPYYQASGRLRVEPIGLSVISKVDEYSVTGFYRRYIRTQIKRLEERSMIERALYALPPSKRAYFVAENGSVEEVAEHLENQLEVEEIRDSLLISVDLKGNRPEGLAPLVNSLMTTFIASDAEADEARDERRIEYLVREETQLQGEIAELRSELSALAKETGVATFSSAYDPFQPKLRELEVEYARALRVRAQTEGEYVTRQEQTELFQDLPVVALIEEAVERDEGLWRIDFYTYQQLQDLRAEIQSMAETNPERQYLIERMEGLSRYLGSLRQDVRNKAEFIIGEKRDFEIRHRLLEGRVEYESALQAQKELEAERTEVLAKLRRNASLIIQGQFLTDDLNNKIDLLERLTSRIQVLRAESKAPGLISLESKARRPTKIAGSLIRRYVAAFFILAYGGVAGWYVIRSVLDNRVREEQDIINALGFPPTWPVPQYIPGAYSEVPFHRVTAEEGEDPVAKAIRSLAFRLYHEWKKYGSQVVLFTGVQRRVGATELLLNCAHPLRKIGESVLLIDLNNEHPQLGELLDLEEDPKTIRDVLEEGLAPEEAIVHDSLRDVDVLVSRGFEIGKVDLGGLLSLIRWARERYNIILIDTAPVLKYELSELLVDASDVSVLIVQGDRTLYRDLRRSAERLGRLGAPVFAAALNWGKEARGPSWQLQEEYLKTASTPSSP